MKSRLVASFLVVGLMALAISAPTFAEGPICNSPICSPVPVCGPSSCPPPGREPGPLSKIFSGTFNVVTGVVSLPFKLVGKLTDCFDSSPSPSCQKTACCPAPPVTFAPIVKCGPSGCCPPPYVPVPPPIVVCFPAPVCGTPGR